MLDTVFALQTSHGQRYPLTTRYNEHTVPQSWHMGEPLSAETQARVNQLMPSHAGGGSVPFNPVVLQPPVSPAFTFAQQPSQQQPARAPMLLPTFSSAQPRVVQPARVGNTRGRDPRAHHSRTSHPYQRPQAPQPSAAHINRASASPQSSQHGPRPVSERGTETPRPTRDDPMQAEPSTAWSAR